MQKKPNWINHPHEEIDACFAEFFQSLPNFNEKVQIVMFFDFIRICMTNIYFLNCS
jgi:hypothetical protein